MESGPQYIYILQSFVFSHEKVIFSIVCTFMLHNLHLTYIQH